MSAAKALSLDKGPPAGADARAPDPSMEDILASIRRIIADDQSRHASANGSPSAAAHRPPPPVLPAPKVAAPAHPAGAAAMVGRAFAPVAPQPGADKPVNSVEQSGMPVGRDPKTSAIAHPHLNPPAGGVDADVDRSVIDEIASAGVAAALQRAPVVVETLSRDVPPAPAPVAAEPPVTPVPAAAPEPRAGATPTVVEPALDEAPKAAASAPAAEEPKDEAEPLISSAADASIESSFNALATTVLMQNTGLIENMVRDTLKPMLRQWLESNLPAIVERLVKVEIERVARGGRP